MNAPHPRGHEKTTGAVCVEVHLVTHRRPPRPRIVEEHWAGRVFALNPAASSSWVEVRNTPSEAMARNSTDQLRPWKPRLWPRVPPQQRGATSDGWHSEPWRPVMLREMRTLPRFWTPASGKPGQRSHRIALSLVPAAPLPGAAFGLARGLRRQRRRLRVAGASSPGPPAALAGGPPRTAGHLLQHRDACGHWGCSPLCGARCPRGPAAAAAAAPDGAGADAAAAVAARAEKGGRWSLLRLRVLLPVAGVQPPLRLLLPVPVAGRLAGPAQLREARPALLQLFRALPENRLRLPRRLRDGRLRATNHCPRW